MVLEWTTRHNYVLTELVFFLFVCGIIFATFILVLVIFLLHFKKRSFSLLRPLFQSVFTSAIAFSERTRAKIRIVFQGHILQEDDENVTRKIARVWVHVYFTLLCAIAVLWFATVFSDAVLYRKTGTCLDLDVRDSDARCFLLSGDGIPLEVQDIIDQEPGEAVPCQRVQNYLILSNSTYDLEVVCYLTRLSPLPALGVAYGTMKTLIFAIVTVLTIFLAISKKIKAPDKSTLFIAVVHLAQIGASLVIIIIIGALVGSLHGANDTRNTPYDYLRGERFYHFSVVTLGAITILVTFGLFPWWAFKPLAIPSAPGRQDGNEINNGRPRPGEAANGDGNQQSEDWRDVIHSMILLNQFSIRYHNDD
jgi:hypothetical protein